MSESNFNGVAIQYCSFIKPIPLDYSQLLISSFELNKDKTMVELGCGNGDLSFAIAKSGCRIQAVDISSDMIDLAIAKNNRPNINYICKDVFDLSYEPNTADLLISYESIHLFHPLDILINYCSKALKQHGYLCMGWCEYNWETPLRNVIVSSFENNGVKWGAWGFSKHEPFFDIVENKDEFSPITYRYIEAEEKWVPEEIAGYLLSISKALELSPHQRESINFDLLKGMYNLGNVYNGFTKYCIAYAQKR